MRPDKPSHREDKGSPYAESISKKLKASGIECHQASADRIDLFDILRALRTIIMQEKGNHILVNVSVGSKTGNCFNDGLYDVQGYSNNQTLLCCP